MRFAASPPSDTLLYCSVLTGYEPKLPFLCLIHVHMKKRLKSKPGSPTEPASTTVPQVRQDDEPHPTMANREMNKPFTLVITIPHDAEMSAVFSPLAVETAVFPVDRDNETLHTFIVDKITDMTTNAMKPFFEMSSEIRDALHRLVQEHYKRDATGEEYFRFLTSHCPNNSNVALTFGAACARYANSQLRTPLGNGASSVPSVSPVRLRN